MKSELKWWSDNIHSQNRIIDRGNADISITTEDLLSMMQILISDNLILTQTDPLLVYPIILLVAKIHLNPASTL
jgi:hypothetical protein